MPSSDATSEGAPPVRRRFVLPATVAPIDVAFPVRWFPVTSPGSPPPVVRIARAEPIHHRLSAPLANGKQESRARRDSRHRTTRPEYRHRGKLAISVVREAEPRDHMACAPGHTGR